MNGEYIMHLLHKRVMIHVRSNEFKRLLTIKIMKTQKYEMNEQMGGHWFIELKINVVNLNEKKIVNERDSIG